MSLFPLRLAAFLSGSKSSSRDQPPVLLEYRSSTVFIVFAVCLAVFTDILLYGLVVPVIPFSITVRAGVSEGQAQQWTAILLACYTGALFIASPFVGIYADHTASRRLPLLLGLLALAGSTVLLCLGRCVALLIVGRLLQGLSAAIVWSVGLALLADTMGGNVGVAMGYVSIAMSLGFFVAPMLGGAVYATAGFYAVFYVAFGVIFLDIVVRLVLIEKKVARQWLPEDTSGGGVSQGSKGMATDSSPNSAVPDEPHLSPAGTQHPYLTLCKSRRLLASLFGCFLISGLMLAFDTIMPIFVKNTYHWNSTAAGLVFMCVVFPGFFAPLVGLLADRYGARWPAVGGFAATIPLVACMRFVAWDDLGHQVLLGVLFTILGVTMTFVATPLMAEISYVIEAKQARHPGIWGERGVYGIGYGLFNLSFALGGTVGSLMSGYIVEEASWTAVTWSLAVWVAPGVVTSAIWVGRRSRKPNATSTRD